MTSATAQVFRPLPTAKGTLSQFLWNGSEDVSVPKMLAYGAVVWSIYSIVQLLVNGIVIDEVVMPAQIIAGAVRYPMGHPHQFVYPRLFSLPNYVAAGFWKLVPNALLISAFRNFVYLLMSAMTPFSVAVVLTRRPMWGYLAAGLALTETFDGLMGVYPLWMFPFSYSHGQIALHLAILAAVFLLVRCWRVGGFVLGVLPAFHAPMVAVVWPWAAMYNLFSGRAPQNRDKYRFFASFGCGILICMIMAAILFHVSSQASFSFPYSEPADAQLIHRNFTFATDVHRHLFTLKSAGYLLNPLAFVLFGMLVLSDLKQQSATVSELRKQIIWVLVFGAFAWVWVFGSGVAQAILGQLPNYAERLMPYRFSNMTVVLLPPLIITLFATALEKLTSSVRVIATTTLIVILMVAAGLLCAETYAGILPRGFVAAKLMFVLLGVSLAVDLLAHRFQPRRRMATVIASVAIGGGTLLVSPHSHAWLIFTVSFLAMTGALLLGSMVFKDDRGKEIRPSFSWVLICVLVSLAALPGRRTYCLGVRGGSRWDTFTADDAKLNTWLSENTGSGELILSGLYPPFALQPKTNHPVLMEWETVYLMTYVPEAASQIGMMLRDLYGIDYADTTHIRQLSAQRRLALASIWIDTWRGRKLADWQLLQRKYGFRLVISPMACRLQLPVVLSGNNWLLYKIPAEERASAPSSPRNQ